jgi:hypothetical protein
LYKNPLRRVFFILLSYGGAVHSSTDPHANVPGMMMYDAKTASRAFASMHNLLDEVFKG